MFFDILFFPPLIRKSSSQISSEKEMVVLFIMLIGGALMWLPKCSKRTLIGRIWLFLPRVLPYYNFRRENHYIRDESVFAEKCPLFNQHLTLYNLTFKPVSARLRSIRMWQRRISSTKFQSFPVSAILMCVAAISAPRRIVIFSHPFRS